MMYLHAFLTIWFSVVVAGTATMVAGRFTQLRVPREMWLIWAFSIRKKTDIKLRTRARSVACWAICLVLLFAWLGWADLCVLCAVQGLLVLIGYANMRSFKISMIAGVL